MSAARSAVAAIVTVITLTVIGYAAITLPTGCGAAQHEKARSDLGRYVEAASAAVGAAAGAFAAWDEQHQLDIVNHADAEEGRQKLTTYRARRQVVRAAFSAAYTAVAAAAALVLAVEVGEADAAELAAAVEDVASAIVVMRNAVAALTKEPS